MRLRLQLELMQDVMFRGSNIDFVIWGITASMYSGLFSPILF